MRPPRTFAGLFLAAVFVLLLSGPAAAQAPDDSTLAPYAEVIDGVGNPDPNAITQWLAADAAVWDIEIIGNTVYVGGTFTTVTEKGNAGATSHNYLAAFDGSTGEWIDQWQPQLDGPVYSLDSTSNGDLLVGGEFKTVNGRTDNAGLVALDATTAQVLPGFKVVVERRWTDSRMVVRDLFTTGNRLYAAGNFNHVNGKRVYKVVRLDRNTGQLDHSFIPEVTGRTAYTVAESADGQRVHIGGQFSAVNGEPGTAYLATVTSADAQLVDGWSWDLNTFCCKDPKVLALDVAGDNLFIAGVNDFWAMLSSATGETRKQVPQAETQDAQVVEVFGDRVYIGCHCSKRGDWLTVVSATTGEPLESFSSDWGGSDGSWAVAIAPDGCIWTGGAFDSAVREDGTRFFASNLIRTCPVGGPAEHGLQAITPPAPPEPFECVVAVNAVGVQVSWPNIGANGYDVIADDRPARWTRSTSIIDVSPATTYTVVAWGNGQSGRTTSCVNDAPGGGDAFTCTVEPNADGSLSISWTDLGARGYDVLEDDQPKRWTRQTLSVDETPGLAYSIVAWGNGFSGQRANCV